MPTAHPTIVAVLLLLLDEVNGAAGDAEKGDVDEAGATEAVGAWVEETVDVEGVVPSAKIVPKLFAKVAVPLQQFPLYAQHQVPSVEAALQAITLTALLFVEFVPAKQ